MELLDENGDPFAAYRYDTWGNPMGNVEASEVCYEQDDSLFTYPDPNPWSTESDAQASGGSFAYVNETGASVTIEFEGSYLEWIATTAADYGIADVTLDGVPQDPVDLYSETTLYQQGVWDTGTLSEGSHTVTIEWTGLKNESPTCTDYKIALDAVEVVGLPGSGNVAVGIWAQETKQGETTVISLDLATDVAQRQVLRYASYCYDAESGMYYLSCRHYDPVTRQFLSKDLSRNDGEESAYQYCLGNPVSGTDHTGYYPLFETGDRETDLELLNGWRERQVEEAKKRARTLTPNHPVKLKEGPNIVDVKIPFYFDAPVQYYSFWLWSFGEKHWDVIYNGLAETSLTIFISNGEVLDVAWFPVTNVRPAEKVSLDYGVQLNTVTFKGGWGEYPDTVKNGCQREVFAYWHESCNTALVSELSYQRQVTYGVDVGAKQVAIAYGYFFANDVRMNALVPDKKGMGGLLNDHDTKTWNLDELPSMPWPN